MNFKGDFHTHTKASDGHCTVAENVRAAIDAGLDAVAITDHSFTSMMCHMTEKKFDAQSAEIEKLNAAGDIKILHGVEANLANPRGDIDVPDAVIKQCDVLLLGFHRLIQLKHWKGATRFLNVNGWCPKGIRLNPKMIEMNTAAFISALDRYPIDIIAHLNHRALTDSVAVCKKAAEKDVYIELNERHLETLEDGIGTFVEIVATGVNFIVGSDSHRCENIGRFDRVRTLVDRGVIPADRVFGLGREPVFKDKSCF